MRKFQNLHLQENLKGQIERILFTSEETGYTVAKVLILGRPTMATCIGIFPKPIPGAIIEMNGAWRAHPRWGMEFDVSSCRLLMPSTANGMEKYLGSGLIKGIGTGLARRIVGAFGERTLDVIEFDPQRLNEIPGMGEARIRSLTAAWAEHKSIRSIIALLQQFEVSPTYAARIYRKYGDLSLQVIRKNPYRLTHDIHGIGFITADLIAEKSGADTASPARTEAGIIFILHRAFDHGHVCLPCHELVSYAAAFLKLPSEHVHKALQNIAAGKGIIIEERNGSSMAYLEKFHRIETDVAKMIAGLLRSRRRMRNIHTESAVRWAESRLGIRFSDRQAGAIISSLEANLSVITGGPGTGKTTVIKAISSICRTITDKIRLAAPTGRTAKRMAEITGLEACTVHRLLEFDKRRGSFIHDESSPLDADIVIIDEASMIDIVLMYHLLKALPQEAMLILIGDTDQLPSVAAGTVLRDIIESGIVPCAHLDRIYRQETTSAIAANAHRVIMGEMPVLNEGNGFYFFPAASMDEAAEIIIDLVKNRIPHRFGLSAMDDIQVLSPMSHGPAGSGNLSGLLQAALNPDGIEALHGGKRFRIGDKVIQRRNNYMKNVFNGDAGTVTAIRRESSSVHVSIDGREVIYDYSELDELSPAYAISIHKSQGAEYPAVIIPLLPEHKSMLQRNLLYTAITRGKKLVVLVGSLQAVAQAVNNGKSVHRHGRLEERIRQYAE